MSVFIPPFYTKFGKNVKDLHKKKYEFDHNFKTIHKTADITVENSVIAKPAGLKGYTKLAFPKFSSRGTFEGELHTDEETESKATFKFTKPYPNANLTFNLHSATKIKDKSSDAAASVEADYVANHFSIAATGRSDSNVHKLDLSAAVGMDGVSVGGQVVVNAKKVESGSKSSTVQFGHEFKFETNLGAEYSQSDFTSSFWTDKNLRYVSAGYYQKLSAFHQLGATFKYDTTGADARQLVAGLDYRLDADTTIRGKVDLPTGIVSSAIEHRLPNPNLLLTVAAELHAPNKTVQKFGVGLTFGDF